MKLALTSASVDHIIFLMRLGEFITVKITVSYFLIIVFLLTSQTSTVIIRPM